MDIVIGVRDDVAEAFTRPPAVAQNRAAAIRAFSDLVNNPQSDVGRHPEHYSLWHVGNWDAASGLLVGVDKVFIVNGADVLTGGA